MNFPARSLQSKYPEGLPHQVSEEMKLNRYRETVCTVSKQYYWLQSPHEGQGDRHVWFIGYSLRVST